MNNYQLYEEIGKGRHSTVYKGRRKKSIEYFAVSSIDKSQRHRVLNSVHFLRAMTHKNVIRFCNWYETTNHLWVISEYCTGGDLKNLLSQDKSLPENSIRCFAGDLVQGLQYVHSRRVLYNDLKPSNVLIDDVAALRLYDFGLACSFDSVQVGGGGGNRRVGTASYMAPELFRDDGVVSTASDLWSLGCVLFEMAAGRPPFFDDRLQTMIQNVVSEPTPKLPASYSTSFSELVEGLLQKDPLSRFTWKDVVSSEFWGGESLPLYEIPQEPAFEHFRRVATEQRAAGSRERSERHRNDVLRASVNADKNWRRDVSRSITATSSGGGRGGDVAAALAAAAASAAASSPGEPLAIPTDETPPLTAPIDVDRELDFRDPEQKEREEAAAEQLAAAVAAQANFAEGTPALNQQGHGGTSAVGGGGGAFDEAAALRSSKWSNPTSAMTILGGGIETTPFHGGAAAAAAVPPPSPMMHQARTPVLAAAVSGAPQQQQQGGAAPPPPPPVYLIPLLSHASDVSVKPILFNARIEKAPAADSSAKYSEASGDFSFAPKSVSQARSLEPKEMEALLLGIYRDLTSLGTANTKHAVLTYLETLANDASLAAVLMNSSLVPLCLKLLVTDSLPSQTCALVATIIGLLARQTNFIPPDTQRANLYGAILTASRAPDAPKLRRRAVACLGEVLFYIASQPPTERQLWKVPGEVYAAIPQLLNDEDDIARHYAAKTMENLAATSDAQWLQPFASADIVKQLVAIVERGAGPSGARNDFLRSSALYAVTRFATMVDRAHIAAVLQCLVGGGGAAAGGAATTNSASSNGSGGGAASPVAAAAAKAVGGDALSPPSSQPTTNATAAATPHSQHQGSSSSGAQAASALAPPGAVAQPPSTVHQQPIAADILSSNVVKNPQSLLSFCNYVFVRAMASLFSSGEPLNVAPTAYFIGRRMRWSSSDAIPAELAACPQITPLTASQLAADLFGADPMKFGPSSLLHVLDHTAAVIRAKACVYIALMAAWAPASFLVAISERKVFSAVAALCKDRDVHVASAAQAAHAALQHFVLGTLEHVAHTSDSAAQHAANARLCAALSAVCASTPPLVRAATLGSEQGYMMLGQAILGMLRSVVVTPVEGGGAGATAGGAASPLTTALGVPQGGASSAAAGGGNSPDAGLTAVPSNSDVGSSAAGADFSRELFELVQLACRDPASILASHEAVLTGFMRPLVAAFRQYPASHYLPRGGGGRNASSSSTSATAANGGGPPPAAPQVAAAPGSDALPQASSAFGSSSAAANTRFTALKAIYDILVVLMNDTTTYNPSTPAVASVSLINDLAMGLVAELPAMLQEGNPVALYGLKLVDLFCDRNTSLVAGAATQENVTTLLQFTRIGHPCNSVYAVWVLLRCLQVGGAVLIAAAIDKGIVGCLADLLTVGGGTGGVGVADGGGGAAGASVGGGSAGANAATFDKTSLQEYVEPALEAVFYILTAALRGGAQPSGINARMVAECAPWGNAVGDIVLPHCIPSEPYGECAALCVLLLCEGYPAARAATPELASPVIRQCLMEATDASSSVAAPLIRALTLCLRYSNATASAADVMALKTDEVLLVAVQAACDSHREELAQAATELFQVLEGDA